MSRKCHDHDRLQYHEYHFEKKRFMTEISTLYPGIEIAQNCDDDETLDKIVYSQKDEIEFKQEIFDSENEIPPKKRAKIACRDDVVDIALKQEITEGSSSGQENGFKVEIEDEILPAEKRAKIEDGVILI